jgi:ATP-dependent helicase/nuclease subunit B
MQELSGACSTFLRYASKQNDRQPVFLEATIGLGARNQGSIGSNTIMLDLSNGKRIRIGGRIDRIDKIKETSPPEFVILDYKTGSSYKYTSQDIFGCGRSIQHGVYIHLAESALRERFPDAEVVVFEYFFPGIKEDGLSIKYTRNQLAESLKVIEQLCQIAGNGAFLTTDSPKKDCKYCPYTSMCDTDSLQEKRTAVKLGVVEPVLHYMKELRSREPKQSKK